MEVWPQSPVIEDNQVVCRTVVERPGAERFELWYRFPAEFREAVSDQADAYVCALLFLAMQEKRPVHVHGTVSPALLRNLEEMQYAWNNLLPDTYVPVSITADRESEATPAPDRTQALLTFSGGIDATYSLWRHTIGDAGRQRQPIGAAMLIHGMDLALDETIGYRHAVRQARAITSSVGVPLIQASTNFREMALDWEHVHGAVLAGAHLLLQKGYACGLIASGQTYRRLGLPWGSQPVTDWMFSTGTFPIIHDAGYVDRWQKVHAISSWREARENVRICYETQTGTNCGVCYKCLRSLLLFRAVGGGLPECFPADVDDAFIRGWVRRALAPNADVAIREILDAARHYGTQGSWTAALQRVLKEAIRRKKGSTWRDRLRAKVAIRTRLRALFVPRPQTAESTPGTTPSTPRSGGATI